MKNRTNSDLAHLTQHLSEVTERLVEVVHRLDELEAAAADQTQHMSTIDPENFETAFNQQAGQAIPKRFNPEAGP